MTAVEVRHVTFKYPGRISPVLDDVCFSLEPGQIAAITGPSGSGKSTLGYCICGVIPNLIKGDFWGEVRLNGRAGIVFQDPDTQIFLTTVEDELAFAPENLCLSLDEIGTRIRQTLELIGMAELRRANPSQLSGGQKQLVALGGVLTLSPDILVLDETLSQLDASAQESIRSLMLALKREGKAIIMIEHDKRNLRIADQVWRLDRQGMLQQVFFEGRT